MSHEEITVLHVEDHEEIRYLVQECINLEIPGVKFYGIATPADFHDLMEHFPRMFAGISVIALLDGVVSDPRSNMTLSGQEAATQLRKVASDNNIPLQIMSLSDRPWSFADPGLALMKGEPITNLIEKLNNAIDRWTH